MTKRQVVILSYILVLANLLQSCAHGESGKDEKEYVKRKKKSKISNDDLGWLLELLH